LGRLERYGGILVATSEIIARAIDNFFANTEARLRPESIIGLMVGILILAYTLPTAITTLANTSISADPATTALWGLLPLLVVVAVLGWLIKIK
jgi:hypothetical protein